MKTFIRLLKLTAPLYRRFLAAALLGTATIAASIGLLGSAAFLIATAALHPSIAEIQVAVVGVRFFGISRGIFRYFERLFSHDLTFRILAEIRVHFMARMEKLAPAILVDHSGGELLDGAIGSIETLQHFFIRCLSPVLIAVLTGLGTALFLAWFAPGPALVFTVFFMLSALGLPLLSWRFSLDDGRNTAHLKETLSHDLVEIIQETAELQVDGAMDRRVDSFINSGRILAEKEISAARRDAFHFALGPIFQHSAVWAILFVGIPLLRPDVLTGPVLASLALIAMAAFEASIPLPQAARLLRHQVQAGRKVFSLLDRQPTVEAPREPQPISESGGDSLSDLEIRNLSFRYPGTSAFVLQDINLRIEAGERLALTGPSGAGKSTLFQLLLRFFDPSLGTICYRGVDLKHLDLDQLRRRLGMLSQRNHLFTGTIAENLLMADPHAPPEDILSVCRQAEIEEEIRRMPDGLDTWIGSAGLKLSGGQRRRLAMARTLLQKPEVFLLDEPTAHLDRRTASRLLDSIFEHAGDRTVIHITHRLERMDRYDRVIYFDDGHLVESGTHRELIEKNGPYCRMFRVAGRILD